MIKAKLVDLGLFKITVFLKKHDIIISAFDTTNNILSRDLNYIVYMAMWPNLSNPSVFRIEVITTSIL